jgi:hypothetical protein
MAKEQSGNSQGSVTTGSSDDLIQGSPTPNLDGGGQLPQTSTSKPAEIDIDVDALKKQYEEAEKKLGEQGNELGGYRKFFNEISPLLDKLQAQPEIAEAIMEGKITSELAQAVLDGKVSIGDATNVVEAQKEVKKEMGTKNYEKAAPDEIEKRIEAKMAEMTAVIDKKTAEVEKKLTASEERRNFESAINTFIKKTPDFPEYSEAISKWFEDHPNQFDIEIAYQAVKGKALAEKATVDEGVKASEVAKNMAANAGGGLSQGVKLDGNEPVIDQLVRGISNPNVF